MQCVGRLTHSSSSRGREHQHSEPVESDKVSLPSSPDSREFSLEEEDSSVADSDVSSLHPNRDKGQRHWVERDARQKTVLMEQEPAISPRIAVKDSRVNFRLGTGGLQAKVDYRADPAPKVPPPAPSTIPSLSPLLAQRALLEDEEAKAECLRLLGNVPSQEHDNTKPLTIEYSSK